MEIEMIDNDAPLTLQTRAALALNSTHTERDLVALATKNASIVAVIDKAGREQAHGAAMELKRARTTIAKVSKDAREDATQFQKAIIAEEKRLIAIIEPEEARLTELRDQFDQEQARIKAEAEARERARITVIHERIGEIRSFSAMAAQCRTASRVAELLAKLQAFDMEGFEEFSEEAATVHTATLSGVKFIYEEKVTEEAERARIKAQQEADAAALAKAQAEQAAAAAQLAADRAAFEKERAELAAAKAAAAQAIEDAKPKVAPVDAYEQELQAFAAVVAPAAAPVLAPIEERVSPAMLEQFNKTYPTQSPAKRPTDVEIVEVLANHFRCHELRIVDWLLSMDLDTVGKELAAEFV
ncbi:MAG: hypothetical protein HXX19_20990 [Rhodoferax sp.]|nr:hypothetical protein [Rhodoferax sp.]